MKQELTVRSSGALSRDGTWRSALTGQGAHVEPVWAGLAAMVRQGRGGKVRSSKMNAAQLFFCCLLVSELAHTNAQAGFPGIWEAGKSGHGQGRAGWAQGRGCMAEWGWSGSTMSRAGRRGGKTWDVWPGWARPVHRWSVWLVCEGAWRGGHSSRADGTHMEPHGKCGRGASITRAKPSQQT